MTIASTSPEVRLSANGSDVDFNFTFKIYSNTDIKVYTVDTNDTWVLQVLGVNYTVVISSPAEGGTVTFGSAPSAGLTVVIYRNLETVQAVSIPADGALFRASIEQMVDKAVGMIADIKKEMANRFGTNSNRDVVETESLVVGSSYIDTDGGVIEVDRVVFPDSSYFSSATGGLGPSTDFWNGTQLDGSAWTFSRVSGTNQLIATSSVYISTSNYCEGTHVIILDAGGQYIPAVVTKSEVTVGPPPPFTSELRLLVNSDAISFYTDGVGSIYAVSRVKIPGFLTNWANYAPVKYSLSDSDYSDYTQSSPVAGTWYNLGGLTVKAPKGRWQGWYTITVRLGYTGASLQPMKVMATLSSANNSEAYPTLTTVHDCDPGLNAIKNIVVTLHRHVDIVVTAESMDLYLNVATTSTGANSLEVVGTSTYDGGESKIYLEPSII